MISKPFYYAYVYLRGDWELSLSLQPSFSGENHTAISNLGIEIPSLKEGAH